jgi:hypothetical protein
MMAAGRPFSLRAMAERPVAHETYSDEEVAKAASDFFSSGAKELSDVLAKVGKRRPLSLRRRLSTPRPPAPQTV